MIELMTAMALAAVVAAALIPIVMSGKRIEKRSMEQTAALMAGDGGFEYLKEELQIRFGSNRQRESSQNVQIRIPQRKLCFVQKQRSGKSFAS